MCAAINSEIFNWSGPLGLPRFDKIASEDFAAAFEQALVSDRNDINGIADQRCRIKRPVPDVLIVQLGSGLDVGTVILEAGIGRYRQLGSRRCIRLCEPCCGVRRSGI